MPARCRTLIFALALGPAAALRAGAPSGAQVVVLYNRTAPGSEAVARHYAASRHVPDSNLLGWAMPDAETITWAQFVASIWQPLQDRLIESGWIDGRPAGSPDRAHRKSYKIAGHRIAALVLCRGVPLRVADDRTLSVPNEGLEKHPEINTNAGSVESELSLLAAPQGYEMNGLISNPLFAHATPSAGELLRVVKISRLDGPTVADANALVDHALAAEKQGLLGRAYVDLGGRYPDGDQWLGRVAEALDEAGFSEDVDRDPNTLAPWVRFDAPALYFGWYASDLNGPFTLPGFSFPPGAIAVHIHSFSAQTLRSPTTSWCGPFLARGVTATVGNVWEPYLQFTHRPDLLLRGLLQGMKWVDAVYYSLPELSWACVAVGDPLYQPFAVGWDAQAARFDRLPPALAGYAAIRVARVLDRVHLSDRALPVLRSAMQARPSLALGIELARRLRAGGYTADAAEALKPALRGPIAVPGEWGALAQAASLAETLGRPDLAEAAYRRLLAMPALTDHLRAHWLVDAQKAAEAAHDPDQAAEWRRQLDVTVAALLKP
jgi:uncharacterized protein (TIGR03790 family)